jgi:SAM-dependent methyltransferase
LVRPDRADEGRGADERSAIYDDLHHGQLTEQEEANRYSARTILSGLFGRFRPESVLDVGCGVGTWLATARELGVTDVFGIEGEWLDRKLARIPADLITTVDLEKGFDLGRRFDLVICLEVAEHLSSGSAGRFVESLTAHADVLLFSAAIPFQGGHHHVNEQFPGYWNELFGRSGFLPVDFIRRTIWDDRSVLWWLRQNVLVFAKRELATGGGPFAGLSDAGPLSIVHPEVYMARLEALTKVAEEHDRLMTVLGSGKPISVERSPTGELKITAGP